MSPHLVGDPVDVISGAITEVQREFELPGPLPFLWRRHYNSGRSGSRYGLGWGHGHEYERSLRFDLDGVRYTGPLGTRACFPILTEDGDSATADGLTLHRVSSGRYRIAGHAQPTFEFVIDDPRMPTPLAALVRGQHRTEFHYDERGYLDHIMESAGRYIRVTCDPAGRVLRLTRLGGRDVPDRVLIAYTYDAAGNLMSGLDAYDHQFSFAFDSANRMVRRTDRRGYSFQFTYDELGRCVHSRGSDGLYEIHLRYLPLATIVTRRDGGQWTYQHDGAVVTRIIDPYGGQQDFAFDEHGRISREIDPNGNVTAWLYNEAGVLIGRRSPIGTFLAPSDSAPTRDRPEHRMSSCPVEWELGESVLYEGIAPPKPGSPTLKLLPVGLRKLVRTAERRKTKNREGHSSGICALPEEFTSIHTVNRTRDEFGLPVRDEFPDGTIRRWSYDAAGNVVRYTDRTGSLWKYEYAGWNQLVRLTDPLGSITEFQYTSTEKLATVTDPCGTTSEYRYDLKDRLIEVRRDDVPVSYYRYDNADNLIEKRDGEGRSLLKLEIGPANLPVARRFGTGQVHEFEYDDKGRYVRVACNREVTTFAYDDAGHRIADQRDGLGVEHEFVDDRLAATTILGRFSIRYDTTDSGTIVLRDPTGGVHTIRDFGRGLVLRSHANGSAELTQLDAEGRYLLKAIRGQQGVVTRHTTFGYSSEGDLVQVAGSEGSRRYSYDPAHRLIVAVAPDGSQHRFAYDAADNLISQPGLTDIMFTHGNRLQRKNGQAVGYDERGCVATMESAEGPQRFIYDERGMLVAGNTTTGPWHAEYDPIGRRTAVSTADRRTQFYWDSDRLAAEVRHNDSFRIYVYAAPLACTPILFIDYTSIDDDPALGTVYTVFTNQIGAPVRVEDSHGEPVWSARILPYGKTLSDASASVAIPHRFPGHLFDEETGLHYNRFRYYDPETGRYLQPDPIGVGGGLNLYAYTPRPMTKVDLRGLSCPRHPAGRDPNCEDCDDNEITQIRGIPPVPPDPSTVEASGPPSAATTFRPWEVPYRNPPEMYQVRPGQPLDVNRLDTNKTYLWVVDPDGNVLIAPERQSDHGRAVKHGDLTPGPNGQSRGPARGGGELKYDAEKEHWVMNNESSYTFRREDGRTPTGDNLNAAHDLLTQSGTDTSNIDTKNSHGIQEHPWDQQV